MRGIDWQALPILAAMYGVEDVELLIHQLLAIREHKQTMAQLGGNP